MTLGQVMSGWVAQLDQALEGIRHACRAVCAGDRRNRGRHGPECAPAIRRGGGAEDRGGDRQAVCFRAQQICRALRA